VLSVAAGAAWAGILVIALTGQAGRLGHDHLIEGHVPVRILVPAFAAGWLLMVLAMMLPPEVVPVPRRGRAGGLEPPAPPYLVVAGYLIAWMAFGLIALDFDAGVHATVDNVAWLTAHPELVRGAVFLLAGLFELSAVKAACQRLDSGLWRTFAPGPLGPRAALAAGLQQGLRAAKSCWALMLVALAVGMGDLTWMVLLTAVLVAERIAPDSRRLPTAVGAGLDLVGALTELLPRHAAVTAG
jgi:predicted metal-binding membrane protein